MGLCEISARKIHHHTLGLHGQNGLGLTPADVYALPARPDAVDTETGRWHLGELTNRQGCQTEKRVSSRVPRSGRPEFAAEIGRPSVAENLCRRI